MAARLAAIDAELAQLRRAGRQERDAERALERQWRLTERMRRVVFVAFDQTRGDPEAATVYLATVAKERHWPAKSEEELGRLVEDTFIEMTDTDAGLAMGASLSNLSDPFDVPAMRTALKYSEEWHMAAWIRRLNTLNRATPSTDEVLEHWEVRRQRLPDAVRTEARGTSLDAGARKWATRLRDRWGGCIGRLRVRDEVPPDVLRAKANAVWRWWNYLESITTLPLLRVNMDETAICLNQGGGLGNVFARKRPLQELVDPIPAAKRRSYMSHVAFICDRAELQQYMPQVFVGNFATFLQRDMAALLAASLPNVTLIRQKSAWNNAYLCARIVRILRDALAPHAAGLRIVLLLDASKVHLSPPVLSAIRRALIWPVFVPASLTWLLQPLDTHAFSLFKHVLRIEYQRMRGVRAGGRLSMVDFLHCVQEAVRRVLNGRVWGPAFDGDGYGRRQAQLSLRVVAQVGADALDIPTSRPSDEQIRLCLPRGSRVPVASLLPPVTVPAVRLARAPVVVRAAPTVAPAPSLTRSGTVYGS